MALQVFIWIANHVRVSKSVTWDMQIYGLCKQGINIVLLGCVLYGHPSKSFEIVNKACGYKKD